MTSTIVCEYSMTGLSRLIAGALVLGTLSLVTPAPAAAQNKQPEANEQRVPNARATLQSGQADGGSEEARTAEGDKLRERRKAPWQDCKPGGFWMMPGVDYDTTMMCK